MNVKASYAGGIVSVVSAFTINEWAVLIGIFTALFTFFMNVWFTMRKDRREQQLKELAEQEILQRIIAQGLPK